MTSITGARSFLGIQLNDDVSTNNMLTFYFACLCSIMLASFIPQSQPFILTEYLNIPKENHGVVSGMLNFWAEIVIILSVAIAGPLSDRLGRKLVTAFGFLLMSGGTFLYPYADSLNSLLAYRLLYSVGIAAVSAMVVTLVADYAVDKSRGKATGLLGVMNGIGAMITVFLLLRLPALFQQQGMTAQEAGYQTYALVAGITLLTGVLMLVGLKPHKKELNTQHESFIESAKTGVRAARDPGVALAYGASFLARGNLMIVGTFFTLWITNYGTSVLDLSRADALAKAGAIVGIAQGCALLTAPIFGWLSDKLNRVHALMIALFISAIGYGSTYFIDNPFGTGMIFCAILIGLGEIGCIITSGVLIAQQTPAKMRGAAIGFFTMSGAVGILIASVAGGYLYDLWRPSGPFVFFGIIALLVFIWATLVRHKVVPLAEAQSANHIAEPSPV